MCFRHFRFKDEARCLIEGERSKIQIIFSIKKLLTNKQIQINCFLIHYNTIYLLKRTRPSFKSQKSSIIIFVLSTNKQIIERNKRGKYRQNTYYVDSSALQFPLQSIDFMKF